MSTQALSYAIDEQDRLIKVDDGYYRFAAENGWEGAGDSLGRSIWDFVTGHDVKLNPDAPRDESDFLPMCAWCDRFLVEGEWVEVEEAAKRLKLFRRSRMPELDHGICPECSGQLLAA
jgi:hypothetical protein